MENPEEKSDVKEAQGAHKGKETEAKKDYAFATTIFGGDTYVGTAMVLAHSLRTNASQARLVVMVGSDVSSEGKAALRKVFDDVIEVELLEGRVVTNHGGKRFKGFYDHWLPKCFTKFRAFELEQYEKICLLDADMVAVGNPDGIFELATPAGICSTVKESDNLHGKRLSKQIIRKSLGNYGIRGCLLLLTPSKAEFEKIHKTILEGPDNLSESSTNYIGPDEKMLTEHYWNDWVHVSSAYGCTAWKTEGVEPIILHYVSEKPWNATEDWPDLKIWWDVSEDLISKKGEELRSFFPKPNKKKKVDYTSKKKW